MTKKITITVVITLFMLSIISCNKDVCFECKKENSTVSACGEDARQFKRDREKEGYTCSRFSE